MGPEEPDLPDGGHAKQMREIMVRNVMGMMKHRTDSLDLKLQAWFWGSGGNGL